MRFGRRVWIAATLAVCGTVAIRGELEPWVQQTASGPAIGALFRNVAMPGGSVPIRRPPRETVPAPGGLIAGSPREATLYRLRAREAETALDFAAAEADWRNYARLAFDSYGAQIELADFYERQARPRDELAALEAAAHAKDDPLQPATAQRGWHAFERMVAVIERDALPETEAEPVYRAWSTRYRKEPSAWRKLIEFLTAWAVCGSGGRDRELCARVSRRPRCRANARGTCTAARVGGCGFGGLR